MKKLCLLLCVVLVCAVLSMPTYAAITNEKPLLSQMSEEECVAFVKEQGIELPNLHEDESEWGSFVKWVVSLVEVDPAIEFGISYTVTAKLAEEIRRVVCAYYGIDDEGLSRGTNSREAANEQAWLVDSELYGEWDPNYVNYNCYSLFYRRGDCET